MIVSNPVIPNPTSPLSAYLNRIPHPTRFIKINKKYKKVSLINLE